MFAFCFSPPKQTLTCNVNIFNKRQGQVDVNFCYFYTDTIYQFRHLLANDALKLEVISSLQYLVQKEIVTLYGFVIMPNHIHLLWYILRRMVKKAQQEVWLSLQHSDLRNICCKQINCIYINLIKMTVLFNSGKETRWQFQSAVKKFSLAN